MAKRSSRPKPRWRKDPEYQAHNSGAGHVRLDFDGWFFETKAVGRRNVRVNGVAESLAAAKAACERWAGIVRREAGK